MKYLKSYKVFESVSKPEPKYPVNYKCIDIEAIREQIEEKSGLDLSEIPCKGSKYGSMDIFRWFGSNLTPIYPKYTMSEEIYKEEEKRFKPKGIPYNRTNHFERDAVYEIPISYDSSGDLEKWNKRKDNFRRDMTKMAEMSGRKYDPSIEDKVDFGPKSNDWVNTGLSKIHELYSQYYVNGKLLVWNSESGFYGNKAIFDYPMDKAYFLSDLENWLSDTFDVDTTGFYEWVLQCQFIEGRYWETTWTYELEDINFRKQVAPDNIIQINEILRQIYKVDLMEIYIDYYKPVSDKVLD